MPDEVDPHIDFTWFYFIGRARLNLTDKEVGRLTLTTFNKLYKHYQDTFSTEMRLKNANMTYEEAYNKAQADQEWL